jgi:hypothetical protein
MKRIRTIRRPGEYVTMWICGYIDIWICDRKRNPRTGTLSVAPSSNSAFRTPHSALFLPPFSHARASAPRLTSTDLEKKKKISTRFFLPTDGRLPGIPNAARISSISSGLTGHATHLPSLPGTASTGNAGSRSSGGNYGSARIKRIDADTDDSGPARHSIGNPDCLARLPDERSTETANRAAKDVTGTHLRNTIRVVINRHMRVRLQTCDRKVIHGSI